MELKSLYNKITDSLISENSQFPLWYIVSFIFGISFYFRFNFINLQYIALPILISSFALYFYKRSPIILILTFFTFGISIAYFRTEFVDTKMVTKPIYSSMVKARVLEVKQKSEGRIIIISEDNKIAKSKGYYKKLRVVSTNANTAIKSGDLITFKAIIVPSQKTKNSDFDFRRYDYYNGISGTAFTKGKIKIIKRNNLSKFSEDLNNFRKNISDKIISYSGVRTGSLAAALIVGERSMIPKQENEQIRVAGLSHVFAVSGMHLSLIAAIIFFLTRYSLSYSSYISQKYNTKKLAAFVAIVATLFYLFITGVQVSAVRAFIMISLFMIAVIFDLQPDLKRAIGASAFAMLLFFPEYVFQPGFQLSFIATLALIAIFEILKKDSKLLRNRSTFFLYSIGVIISSFIATIATSMFVLYHFKFVSSYSVAANLAVSPIISLLIMPCVVLHYLLFPFNLENIALAPINLGLELLLKITSYTSSLSYSKIHLTNYQDLNLFIFTFGIFWLCLWRYKKRYLGLIPILLAFLI